MGTIDSDVPISVGMTSWPAGSRLLMTWVERRLSLSRRPLLLLLRLPRRRYRSWSPDQKRAVRRLRLRLLWGLLRPCPEKRCTSRMVRT